MRTLLLLLVLLAACARPSLPAAPTTSAAPAPAAPVQVTELALQDAARERSVPVALYVAPGPGRPRLALLSHGYGGRNTDYTFLAHALAARGYWVASVQHQLPGDAPLPKTGNPREVRRPSWLRGVADLHFVLQELQRRHPDLDTGHLLLVGASHGGDTAALFVEQHPGTVERLITLDNRRFPLPRTRPPHVLTLRSSDQPADVGVLPDAQEQQRLGMRVVALPATRHDDMWDGATAAQKQEMLRHVSAFLEL